MALIVPVKCPAVPLTALSSCGRRQFKASAALSSPPRGRSAAVDWVKETASFFEQDSRPIMLFDGVCNLCNGGVKFVLDNDRRRNIRFEALQSEAGKKLLQRSGRAPDDISSVVLVENDRSYIKSEAVLKIMEYIDLPFSQLAIFLQFVPLFLRLVGFSCSVPSQGRGAFLPLDVPWSPLYLISLTLTADVCR